MLKTLLKKYRENQWPLPWTFYKNDIKRAYTEKITPAASLKLRNMEPKQASFWLENEFPQINTIHIPRENQTASLLVYDTVITP